MLLALTLAAVLLSGVQAAAAPVSPPTITLRQAIALAASQSPFRGSAVASAAAAADAAALAGRPLNPQVEFRTENWTPSAARSLPLDVWALVSQPIELGGKRQLRRAIAVAEHDVAVTTLAFVDRELTRQVTQFYFQALRARTTLESATANRDGVSMLVHTMSQRLDEGYVAESDLLRFQAEAARLDIDVARAGLELARSLDALTAATGASARIDAAQLVDPAPVAAPALDGASIAAAVERHPEVLAATAKVARAEQALAFERARRLPDPAFVTGYKRTLGISTLVAAVTTTLPLFDRNGTGAARAAGEVRATAAERDAIRTRLSADASTLVGTARTLADRAARVRAELLDPASGVREAARIAFDEGTVDVLKLIDAERVYGEVRRVALDLQLEALGAAIEARIALGEEPLP